MLPILDPGLRPLWRDPHTVQLGLHPGAPVLGGLDAATAALLRARPTTGTAEAAADDPATAALRSRLTELGVPTAVRSRELAAMTRAARAAATVRVEGAGRVGAAAATLLAAAGVGRVLVEDPEPVGPADTTPAGPRMRDVGRRRDVACEAAIERHLEPGPDRDPDVGRDHERDPGSEQRGERRGERGERRDERGERGADRGTDRSADGALGRERPRPAGGRPAVAPPPVRPDVVVLAPTYGLGRAAARRLLHEGVPHLLAVVDGPYAVVGPFVLPGRSCCLHCTDLHRAARDPAWPRLLDQAEAARGEAAACDLGLATLAAAQAVVQVLALLDARARDGGGHTGDGTPGPTTVGGTLETALTDGLTRRRTWEPHPACGCGWASSPIAG